MIKVEKKIIQLNPVKSYFDLTCKNDINKVTKMSKQSVVDVFAIQDAINKAIEKLQIYATWLDNNCTVTEVEDGTQEFDFKEED